MWRWVGGCRMAQVERTKRMKPIHPAPLLAIMACWCASSAVLVLVTPYSVASEWFLANLMLHAVAWYGFAAQSMWRGPRDAP